MKTNKFLTLLSVFTLLLAITSCVEDDDFATPTNDTVTVVNPATVFATPEMNAEPTTFAAVIARYESAILDGDQVGIFSTEDDDPLYITGYVVSSDQAGNFFEEIIIQNSVDENNAMVQDAQGNNIEDARRGLKVEINVSNLSDTYEFGRKVYIKLNGLAIGEENGVYTLGRAVGSSLEQIQLYEYMNFVLRSEEVATITPKVSAISDLGNDDENTLIQLNDMQVHRTETSLTYAGEPSDEFDGFRTLENCETNATILMQTSTFADFKSLPVPQNRGTIQGVFTRDFGDDFNVFVINSTADVSFNDVNRCDPIELDCGTASSQGTMNLFMDDFESQTNNNLITGNGWTNYIQEGSEGWEAYTSGGTNSSLGRSARVGSFNSGDASSIAWLITPEIDFDAQNGETLVFKTSNSFSDGSNMELLYSTDWDGTEANITTATWGILPAAYIVQDSDFFGAWFDSGVVDLSCAEGTMHIAFKYTGSGQSDFDGTFELDEISIDYTP